MTLKDIYPLIDSHQIILFDITTNKVHKMQEAFGEYEVIRLIPLDYQKLQVTIKNRG